MIRPTPALVAALVALALSIPDIATGEGRAAGSEFAVFFENDLFGDTDANYTNGVKLAWTSPDLTHYRDDDKLPRWTHPIIARLPFINEPGLRRSVVISVGQSMFTPTDTASHALVKDDRPYAGWLYAGAAFHNRNPRQRDVVEVQVGVVGPASMAEQSQKLVHQVRGLDQPNGWDHQLENEPGINIIYERRWRTFRHALGDGGLGPLAADLITHGGASLGNVQTHITAGAELRVGWNLPFDFGTTLIRPGGESSAPSRDGKSRETRRAGVHLFAAAEGRAVGRDIFLDGNTVASSHGVDKTLLVADLIAGVSATVGQLKISFAKALRTREFEGQARRHRFGSITASYRF